MIWCLSLPCGARPLGHGLACRRGGPECTPWWGPAVPLSWVVTVSPRSPCLSFPDVKGLLPSPEACRAVALAALLWSSDDVTFPHWRGVSRAVWFLPVVWAGLLPSVARPTTGACVCSQSLKSPCARPRCSASPVSPRLQRCRLPAFQLEWEKAQLH